VRAEEVIALATRAGQLAMTWYGRDRGQRKGDGSWVTAADGAVEALLRAELHELGDVRVFGEEQGWSGAADARHTAIVDPIDGTALFRDELPLWGVSLAVFTEGRPLVGVLVMPAAGQTFVGQPGVGARCNQQPLRVAGQPLDEHTYLGVSSDGHRHDLHAYPGKIRAFGASGLQVALVATGHLQAALLTRFHLYDVAAAALVLEAAGGQLFDLATGVPMAPARFITAPTASAPLLACHPGAFARLRPLIRLYAG
jgi:inositol-phosphate phosphatase/L-galactose 1-phosphate phosphatase/histidinol-phosphatase